MSEVQEVMPPLDIIYQKVQSDSKFSLYYLRSVDNAINAVTVLRNTAETTERAIKKILRDLALPGGYNRQIDPNGSLESSAASAEASVKETISVLRELDGVLEGTSIPTDDAEMMSGGNSEAISALERLHDTMVDLRWAVLEHDADMEEPEGKVFENVQDFLSDLKSR